MRVGRWIVETNERRSVWQSEGFCVTRFIRIYRLFHGRSATLETIQDHSSVRRSGAEQICHTSASTQTQINSPAKQTATTILGMETISLPSTSRAYRVRLLSLLILFACCIGLALPGWASEREIEAWAEQLAAQTYSAREAAADALILAGPPAEAAVRAHLESSDLDLRRRATRVLREIRQHDYQQKLLTFARDPVRGNPATLPGWERYRELVHDRPSTRRLFLAMHCDEPRLMAALGLVATEEFRAAWQGQSDRIVQAIRGRIFATQPQSQEVFSPPQMAAILFVADDPRLEVPEELVAMLNQHLSTAASSEDWQKSPHFPVLQPIIDAWIAQPRSTKLNYQQMMMGMRYQLSGALVPALDLLEDRQDHARMRMYALLTVGRFGNQTHWPLLEKLLDDDTTCHSSVRAGRRIEVQIRDVALAALVHLAEQPLENFGLEGALPSDLTLFRPHTLGFDSEKSRQAAIQKWQQWRQQHEPRSADE